MSKTPVLLGVLLAIATGSDLQAQLVPGFPVSYYTTNYSVGNSPRDVYLGNLRGNNTFRDLIVANHDDNTITVRLCNDDGTFADGTNLVVGLNPIALRSANLNGTDGDDVVVANFGTNNISVLFNTGAGSFGAATNLTVGVTETPGPIALATSDVNDDGVSDIAVANYNDNTISILTSFPGSFSPAIDYPVGNGPSSVQFRDLTGDGVLDVLAANQNDGTLSLLVGGVGGGFNPAQTIPLFPGGDPKPTQAIAADLNADGRSDIAVLNNNSNTVSILLQANDGTFPVFTNFSTGPDCRKMLLRDLNGDDFADLAITEYSGGTVHVLLGSGDGTFQAGGSYAVGANPIGIAGSNFNSDRLTDLAVANAGADNVSILLYDLPLAGSMTISVNEETARPVTLRGEVLPGRPLTYLITVPPVNGTLSPASSSFPAPLTNLVYTGNSNFFGTDTFSYQITDGVSTSATAVVTILVKDINDAPSFTFSTNEVVVAAPGVSVYSNFAENISSGPGESGQSLDFIITSLNPSFFAVFPSISPAGVLTFTPAVTAAGTNEITVRLRDDAGTANGGDNESDAQTFRIVVPVFPPTVATAPQNQTVVAGENAVFTTLGRGVGALSYQWSYEGSPISGATERTLVVTSPSTAAAGTYSVDISNAGGSVTASAQLSVLEDNTAPTVKLVSPAPSARVLAGPTVALFGTATDNARVSKVLYGINGGGVTNEATLAGSTKAPSWSVAAPMIAGTNVVQVQALDFSDNASAMVTSSFIYVVQQPITLNVIGTGTIKGLTNNQPLEIGKTYKVTAVAGPNYAFSNWTGSASSSSNVLSFMMQSNTVLTANFIPNPFFNVKGVYHGLFYETNGVNPQSSGFFRINVTTNKTWSGYLLVDGDKISGSGKFTIEGTSSATILRTRQNKSPLLVSLNLQIGSGSDQVVGTVTEVVSASAGAATNWTADLLADRQVWSATNLASDWTSLYTMVLSPDTNSSPAPAGFGWGTISVTTNGYVTLNGGVGDASPAKQRTMISKDGKWPLYVPLYSKPNQFVTNFATVPATIRTNKEYEGFLFGWVNFVTNSTQTTLHPEGTLSWVKTTGANLAAGTNDALYATGFTNSLEILGSRYTRPALLTRTLDATNVLVAVTNGNLAATISQAAPFSERNAIVLASTNNPNALKLSVTANTGAINGSFVSIFNGTNRITRFFGAVLQDQNIGRGTFVGTSESGALLLDPQE